MQAGERREIQKPSVHCKVWGVAGEVGMAMNSGNRTALCEEFGKPGLWSTAKSHGRGLKQKAVVGSVLTVLWRMGWKGAGLETGGPS